MGGWFLGRKKEGGGPPFVPSLSVQIGYADAALYDYRSNRTCTICAVDSSGELVIPGVGYPQE